MPQFYTLLTDSGQAKIANAVALGAQIEITQMAVGDGGGNPVTPDSSATVLVNEVRRAPINAVHTDDDNPTWIVIEQVLPPDVGGWTIREVGVFDAAGDLIAIGNLPETYKPVLAEGSSRTQTIRVVMEVSDTAAVTLKVDPSVVLATREYVDDSLADYGLGADDPGAPLLKDFADATTPTGFYRGYGNGAPSPTLNGPAGTGNSRLSAYALHVGGAVHWIVQENGGSANDGHRLFFGNTHNGGVVWNRVWHDGNIGEDSGLDADKLDGQHGDYYRNASNLNAGTMPSARLPNASESVKGGAFVASQTETNEGSDDAKFITAKKLKAWASNWVRQATEAMAGMLKVATQAQVDTGTDDATAVTPKKLRWGVDYLAGTNGYITFPSWMGGFILQWGYYGGGEHNPNISFPLAFTTSVYCVNTTAISNLNEVEYTHVGAITLSAFGGVNYRIKIGSSPEIYTSTTVPFRWFAIGR
ncbi:phage tail protein [Halomonas sp. DP5N14-9]|uniref:phage tail protein n=1 Tax=Halomonas sp. DP5N14-9 TaxID=2859075 RepID=UPI001C99277E|nr:phage tail protein [Halomonas sp. DP5N14-9]MBY5940256.1 phage tail protein [Halomonas sp. DP5N14-9]